MITAAEQQERQEAVEDVIGTQRAEGIQLGPAIQKLMQRYVEGELTLEQVSQALDEHAKLPVALASVA